MAGTDENYPIREWERRVAQSQRILNMLRPCIINPKFSADAFLEGQNDYNAVPFPHWYGECLYLKVLKNGHHGASMVWKASVWAPQKNITDATQSGSQEMEQKRYKIQ